MADARGLKRQREDRLSRAVRVRVEADKVLRITELPQFLHEADLVEHFAGFPVVDVFIDMHASPRFATIEFASIEDAQEAYDQKVHIPLNGRKVNLCFNSDAQEAELKRMRSFLRRARMRIRALRLHQEQMPSSSRSGPQSQSLARAITQEEARVELAETRCRELSIIPVTNLDLEPSAGICLPGQEDFVEAPPPRSIMEVKREGCSPPTYNHPPSWACRTQRFPLFHPCPAAGPGQDNSPSPRSGTRLKPGHGRSPLAYGGSLWARQTPDQMIVWTPLFCPSPPSADASSDADVPILPLPPPPPARDSPVPTPVRLSPTRPSPPAPPTHPASMQPVLPPHLSQQLSRALAKLNTERLQEKLGELAVPGQSMELPSFIPAEVSTVVEEALFLLPRDCPAAGGDTRLFWREFDPFEKMFKGMIDVSGPRGEFLQLFEKILNPRRTAGLIQRPPQMQGGPFGLFGLDWLLLVLRGQCTVRASRRGHDDAKRTTPDYTVGTYDAGKVLWVPRVLHVAHTFILEAGEDCCALQFLSSPPTSS
eukprot:GGOE01017890.1.p1 GENE.GGOE01017890.1~~GGOE01017890.1.p1  ORF type:complete len:551 (+),score=68.81 GGOE01017890.1:42-1655(+)